MTITHVLAVYKTSPSAGYLPACAKLTMGRTAASSLALTPVDGVPIEAAPVMWQHVVRWKRTAPGRDMRSCRTARH